MKRSAIAVLAVLIATCGAVSARTTNVAIGIDYGLFFPSNSATRDAFGDTWPRLSIGQFDVQKSEKWHFSMDFSGYAHSSIGRARLYPLTFGAERALSANPSAQPYVSLRAGPYWGRIEADAIGINEDHVGLNANAALGVILQQRYFVESRYDYFSRFAGFNFDGVTVSVGVRLFDVRM